MSMLKFKNLEEYTTTVRKEGRFRHGDNYITINPVADSVEIDFANRDNLLIRFERGRALVRINFDDRRVMSIPELKSHLESKRIDVIGLMRQVPYLQRTLSL